MEHHPRRPSLPAVPAPPPFTERRRAFRRAEDRAVHEERALLARALDVLAGPGDAATQVAEILALRRAGRRGAPRGHRDRPAVRRVLVGRRSRRGAGDARDLAAWLDARADRPAAVRAAAAPAEVTIVRTRRGPAGIAAVAALRPARWPTGSCASHVPGRRGPARPGAGEPGRRGAPSRRASRPRTLRHVLAALAAATGRAADEAERAEPPGPRARARAVRVDGRPRAPDTAAGLGGYLDLLADGAVDDPEIGREFIERGRGIVERMAALVGDLLELSRIEAGSLRLEIEPLLARRDLRAGPRAARAARRRARHPARDRPPAADPDGPGRPAACRADRDEPRRQRLQVRARGRARRGSAPASTDPRRCVVVRDDGPGIERADRELVFRPFARLDGHERVPGTGLGLPSAATSRGRWAATSPSRRSRPAARRSSSASRPSPTSRAPPSPRRSECAAERGGGRARGAGHPAGPSRRGRSPPREAGPSRLTPPAGSAARRGGPEQGRSTPPDGSISAVDGGRPVVHRPPGPCGRSWITRWITPLTAGVGGRTITVRIDGGPDDGGRRSRGATGRPGPPTGRAP